MAAPDHLGAQFIDLWHGTTASIAPVIRATHLLPSEGRDDVLTVAHDRLTAEDYAHDAAAYDQDDPVVMHFRVPHDEWHSRYSGSYEDFGHSGGSGLREPLPGHYVHEVHPLNRDDGDYTYYQRSHHR